jgi:hypothetical protein
VGEATQPGEVMADTRRVVPRVLLLVLILGLLPATGCYAVPPLRFGAGGGGALGEVATRDRAGERTESSHAGVGQIRAAFAPLAGMRDRIVDVAAGYAVDGTTSPKGRDNLRHGPFLEVDLFTHGGTGASHQRWRFGPTFGVDLHLEGADDDEDGDPGFGVGGSGGVLLEFVEHVHGRFLLGVALGELGMGLAARVGVRHEDGGTHGYALVSVEFRFPAAAGAVIPFRARTSLR